MVLHGQFKLTDHEGRAAPGARRELRKVWELGAGLQGARGVALVLRLQVVGDWSRWLSVELVSKGGAK